MVRKHRRGRSDRYLSPNDIDSSGNVRLDGPAESKYCEFTIKPREMWQENEKNMEAPLNSDLYFLIHQCLSGGPLRKTLQAFREELKDHNILPKRTDWTGGEHDSTIDDLQHQFSHIRPDYLLQLCFRANSEKNTNKHTLPDHVQSLFNLKRSSTNINNIEYNFKQMINYVRRHHWIPLCKSSSTSNIANILRGQEISGSLSRRWIVSPKLYTTLQFQRRTLGHLSAVYCLLFDHSGRYIVTGADDLLIKLWSALTGRLIATFRGASSEITDIAINLENTLLAAGSIDRILRIWDLQSGGPIAVLSGHTGMITSVNFCPSPSWGVHYVITTSTDGSVAFWAYTYDTRNRADFRPKPTVYQERMRPGQAQMICSSFSPGGTFLSTGSADHHVRVYYMKGDEGPHRILEIEAHTDRVDSIQWAHSGLRFLSGSKDGTAIIWSFECQQWKSIYLRMNDTLDKNNQDDGRKLKVTMVAWDKSDNWAVTAVSDYTLKIWNARNGQFCKVLTGHTDEIYVLESHPHDNYVILSAGHDGQLYIWDIIKGETVGKYTNTIENQGYGAIFDAKWSPDGGMIAASDSHGHLLIFGFGNGHKLYEELPKELFFHTDYRPLVKDANNYVLDEQTQIQPHLMPPPFLVDIDGNPYPPMLQRLVPGREHCKTEQLIPSIVIGNEGTQEVIQVVAEELPSRYELDGEASRRPQNRRSTRDEGIRQSTGDWQMDPNIKWKRNVLIPPLRSSRIQAINDHVDDVEKLEMEEYQRQLCQRPHMINTSATPSSSGLAKQLTNEKRRKATNRNRSGNSSLRPARDYVILSEDDSCLDTDNDGSVSSGHSDWEAEESPKRTRNRKKITYNSEESDHEDENTDEDEEDEEEEKREKSPPKVEKRPQRSRAPPKVMNDEENGVENYKTSEWLTETRPRKSPYFPQIGDQLVYFPQGYQMYLDAVRAKNVYEINSKLLACTKQPLRSHEFVKVLNIEYEMQKHPPTLCSMKLAILDEDGRLTGRNITVKYHDMPAVVDFFVLKQNFDVAISRNWKIDDRFRCIIDDCWWTGEIVGKSDAHEQYPQSYFLCYEIKWDNEEPDRMSPWDMEMLDESRSQDETGGALPVLQEELQIILYQPMEDDWPNNNRETAVGNIVAGLTAVMELSIAEAFLAPVDLDIYPTYATTVEYPVDLSTIKSRFENRFYRRATAAQFDVRHLAINAAKFNKRHTAIVKNARIITDLCLRIIKQCTEVLDVGRLYHQLVDSYASSDTEVDVDITPSSSRNLRTLPNRSLHHASEWVTEAKNLLDVIWNCEDSTPFRAPVNTSKYTDYCSIVSNPMDLSIVKERLHRKYYKNPKEFEADVKLIIANSRLYNTNHKSRIHVMTVRLAAFFDEHVTKLINKWNQAKRRDVSGSSGMSKSCSETEENVEIEDNGDDDNQVNHGDDVDEDEIPLNRLQTTRKVVEEDEDDDSDSESSSSSNSEEEDSSNSDGSDNSNAEVQQMMLRSKRKRKVPASDESSNSEEEQESRDNQIRTRSSNRKVKKLRRYSGPKRKQQQSSDNSDTDDDDRKNVLTSVSSRGRIRKHNPRVTALMKK